jgi:hypothetical protein
VEAYFSGEPEEVGQKYSRDMILWLQVLNDGGSIAGSLQTVGLVYYYEFYNSKEAGKYILSVPITNNRSYNTLVDEYVGFGSGRNARERLREKTAPYYRSATGGSEKNKQLYAFYKAMLKSGQMQVEVLDAVENELSYILSEYVDDKAYDKQKHYKKRAKQA